MASELSLIKHVDEEGNETDRVILKAKIIGAPISQYVLEIENGRITLIGGMHEELTDLTLDESGKILVVN